MSWQPANTAQCRKSRGAVRLIIRPREKDLGGFSVRRVLPSSKQRLVGPFVFFDHMGPAEFPPGKGIDVRPHPHIGLATITWLFEGELLHRDSLGSVQNIRPGAVNWMTAGKGIVHSERSPDKARAAKSKAHGIQAWVALPRDQEDIEADFEHYPARALPKVAREGTEITLISGQGFGLESQVKTLSPQFYAEIRLEQGAEISLPDYPQRAVYLVEGEIAINGSQLKPCQMAIIKPGQSKLVAKSPSLLMALGGEAFEIERYIWWNFVASSQDKIEAAKKRWKEGQFDPVPGDDEFIPLPEK